MYRCCAHGRTGSQLVARLPGYRPICARFCRERPHHMYTAVLQNFEKQLAPHSRCHRRHQLASIAGAPAGWLGLQGLTGLGLRCQKAQQLLMAVMALCQGQIQGADSRPIAHTPAKPPVQFPVIHTRIDSGCCHQLQRPSRSEATCGSFTAKSRMSQSWLPAPTHANITHASQSALQKAPLHIESCLRQSEALLLKAGCLQGMA